MTDAELAILGLLSEKPTFDHDLNTLIDQRGLRRWTAIGSSSMYYVLEKLERQGLVQISSEVDGHREFQITPAGVGVLQTSVADLLGTTRAYDKSFELGLANMGILKTSQIQAALLNRLQDLALHRDRLGESLESEQNGGSIIAVGIFSHRLAMIEAEEIWLHNFLETWLQTAPADPEFVIEPAVIPRSRQVVLPQDPDSVHKHATVEVSPDRRKTPIALKTGVVLPKASPKVTSLYEGKTAPLDPNRARRPQPTETESAPVESPSDDEPPAQHPDMMPSDSDKPMTKSGEDDSTVLLPRIKKSDDK